MKLSNFRRHAGPVILSRAKDYLAEGRVKLMESNSGEYHYRVFGTEPYDVHLSINGDEIKDYSCNCPYTYGSVCKHVTACLLDIDNARGETSSATPGKTKTPVEEPKKQEEPDEIMEFDLPSKQLFYLSYLAFTGRGLNTMKETVPQSIHPSWRFPQYKQKEMSRELKKGGWLNGISSSSYSIETPCVNPGLITEILKNLIRNHGNWLSHFKACTQSYLARYIFQLTFALCGNDASIVPALPYFSARTESGIYIRKCLMPILLSEDLNIVKSAISETMAFTLTSEILDHVLEMDELTHLDRAAKILETYSRPSQMRSELYCKYRMVHYFSTGDMLQSPKNGINYYQTHYADAVKALHDGNTDLAIELFQKGLRIQNKLCTFKNIPCDSISFYFYVVALLKRRSPKDVSALKIIAGKERDIKLWRLSAVFPLAIFGQDSLQIRDTSSLRDIRYRDESFPDSTQKLIAAIILHFFGLQDEWNNAKGFPTPHLEILRQECAPWWGATTESNNQSILHSVNVQEPWEIELGELMSSIQKKTAPLASEKPTVNGERLFYIASRHWDRLEVREQSRLKSGSWSKGKKLSLVRYKAGNCPMDDIDRQLHECWLHGDPSHPRSSGVYDFPALTLALPFLVGSDKLMLEGIGGDLQPVIVREEKPYLVAAKTNSGITFSSNVPDSASKTDEYFFDWTILGEIVMYPCTKKAINVLDRLMGMGHVPAKAEPMLEQLFESLGGELEIHSGIRGASEIKQVPGVTKITARIQPEHNAYTVQALVRPLEGGQITHIPGDGDESYYDQNPEGRVKVVRDLDGEKRNLRRVSTLFAELPGMDIMAQNAGWMTLTPDQLLALLSSAQQWQDYLEIEWPEGEKPTLIKPDSSKWEINATGHGGWFELEGELRISEDMVLNMARLMELARQGGRFVRLSENEYIELSEALRKQLARLDAIAQESNGRVKVPELAFAMAGDSLDGEVEIRKPGSLMKLRRRIRESAEATYPIPEGLNATLRYYQEEGYRWMMRLTSWGAGVCLADDMGLGKTVQAIAVMLSRSAEGPSLVVAPASVIINWERELQRFAPSLNVCVLNSQSLQSRDQAVASMSAGAVMITTYGMLVSELNLLASMKWATVCLDEAHAIKNRSTKSSAAAMKLGASYRIILTGTPVQNHLGELWNLFQFINPGLLGSYEHFSERFLDRDSAELRENLKRIVAPFILRRTKREVIRELPDKEEIILPISMSDAEMAGYEVIRREAMAELEGAATVGVSALSMITKLRMTACSESKLDELVEKLQAIVDGGNSVLVFSQFSSFLARAKARLEQAGLGGYLYMDGQTPVRQRQKLVDSFQHGEKKIFLISLKAGGLGLNLTGANYVIHLDPWWNPAIEQQATDRAHRIGQTRKVTVYHLIASQTIEEKILRLHDTKRDIADSILKGSNLSGKLTPAELLAMLDPTR